MNRADDAHREDRQFAEPEPRPDVTLADVEEVEWAGYCPVCLQALEDCVSPGESHGWSS